MADEHRLYIIHDHPMVIYVPMVYNQITMDDYMYIYIYIYTYVIIHNLASHDHLQGIGAPHSPEHIAVSGLAFGKSHDHQGNRRNHALPT